MNDAGGRDFRVARAPLGSPVLLVRSWLSNEACCRALPMAGAERDVMRGFAQRRRSWLHLKK